MPIALPHQLKDYHVIDPCSVDVQDYPALEDLLKIIEQGKTTIENEDTIKWLSSKDPYRVRAMLNAFSKTQKAPV